MDTRRPPRRPRRPRALTLVIASAMLLGVGVASASATSPIEGVWSFGGGEIAVHPSANGTATFEGTVVAETKFAECTHPVNQAIWTGMTLQPDGSYFGFHQWYKQNSSTCVLDPTLGPTAWRVLEAANGSHYLRVCLSNPGTAQPTVAVNGTCVGATYGGVSSALTAPLPVVSKEGVTKESLSLPSAKKCLSARLFQIHLLDPKNDPLKKVSITIKGYKKKIATARKGKYIVATINLKGLPKGAFTVKIKATTVLGHTLSASRTYHTCKKKIKKKSHKKK
jgi:hypothetical protein